jgi:RNA polymerase sigma-70 factor (ECF subfamily)
MSTITTKDSAEIQAWDWGNGRPAVILYEPPPSAGPRQQMLLPPRGYHSFSRDRRGDGRSRQQWNSHDQGTYADGPKLAESPDRGGASPQRVDSSVMAEELRTTVVVQRFLNDLNGDSPAAPIVRELLSHAAERLHVLCSSMLSREYSRLTRPPLNLRSEELLSGLVERLLKAMQKTHPPTVRQFFAMVNQHMRWELNDLARRLDEHSHAMELGDELVPAPESSGSRLGSNARRMLEAIESLPGGEREAFELVRIQGMSTCEVAEIVGVTDRTVQRRLNRASLLLMRALADLRPPEKAGEE